MITVFVLYDCKHPYLPLDVDESLKLLSQRWNVPVKTLYNALRNGCVVRSLFTITKVYLPE